VVVLVFLVRLNYESLCSFLVSFSFLLFLAGKHSREVPEEESSPLVSLAERFGRASVCINL
jgi:hypothetical protein